MTTEPTSEPSVKELAERVLELQGRYETAGKYAIDNAPSIAQAYLDLLKESEEDARIIGASGSRELALMAKVERLRQAFQNTLDDYESMVRSGDCGSWDYDKDKTIVAARAALAATENGEGL